MQNERLKRAKIMLIFCFCIKSACERCLTFFFRCCENKETLWHVQWKRIIIQTHTNNRSLTISFFTQLKKKSFTFGIPCERLTHIRTTVEAREEAKKVLSMKYTVIVECRHFVGFVDKQKRKIISITTDTIRSRKKNWINRYNNRKKNSKTRTH